MGNTPHGLWPFLKSRFVLAERTSLIRTLDLMPQLWIIFALSASMFWGATYAINEQLLKKISISTTLGISMLVAALIFIVSAGLDGSLKRDLLELASSRRLLLLIGAQTLILAAAELCIGLSIVNKNATLAALIEISYPFFTALFAFLLFREVQFSWGIALGALVMFLGIGIVYYFQS